MSGCLNEKTNMAECRVQNQSPYINETEQSLDNFSQITLKNNMSPKKEPDSTYKQSDMGKPVMKSSSYPNQSNSVLLPIRAKTNAQIGIDNSQHRNRGEVTTDQHLVCDNPGIYAGDQVGLKLEKKDNEENMCKELGCGDQSYLTTLDKSAQLPTNAGADQQGQETVQKLTESPQVAVFEGGEQKGADGINPSSDDRMAQLINENRRLREENERLKQKKQNPYKVKSIVTDDLGSEPVVIPLTKRRDRMVKEDRLKIITKMPFLIEQLNPEHLISMLFSKHLICEDEADELRTTLSTKGRSICAENMLYMLLRCGRYAYKIFLKCLELTGYRNVIEELEPKCEIYEGNIKYPGHQYFELIDNKNPKREEFIKKTELDLEEIYESTELVVIKKLTEGCVLVSFHLISLGSKSESELREVLESKVNSGYVGDSKVSTEGFSFKKIERGLGEETDTDGNREDQDSQLVSQENVFKLKRKIEELQGFNSRLRMHIAELETELEEDQEVATDRINDLESDIRTLKSQMNELQRKNSTLEDMEKYKEHKAKIYKDKIHEKEVIIFSLIEQLDQQPTDSGIKKDPTILPIADDRDKDLSILPIDDNQDKDLSMLTKDDNQDKDKVEQREDAERLDRDKHLTLLTKDDGHDDARVTHQADLSANNQLKIRKIIDYLVIRHPDQLKPLVQLLIDKGVIDGDDSKQITKYIDRDDIEVAGRRLSYIINSSPNSYLHLIGCLKELGLSYIEDRFDKERYGIVRGIQLATIKTDLMGFEEDMKHLKESMKKTSISSAHTSQKIDRDLEKLEENLRELERFEENRKGREKPMGFSSTNTLQVTEYREMYGAEPVETAGTQETRS